MTPVRDVAYFGAGPAKLPEEVLRRTQDDILNWRGTGVGILEVSHRSAEYMAMMQETEDRLRSIMDIPTEYSVLFMSGGGTAQFAAVVLNLVRQDPTKRQVDYLISGSWSSKAAQEAERLLTHTDVQVNQIQLFNKTKGELSFTCPSEWNLSREAASYVYYCDNETIDGIEMPSSGYIPDMLDACGCNAPIVVDMSSNFLSRPVNVRRFGAIFATAQKNFGPAGVTIAIIRRNLLNVAAPPLLPIPTTLDYCIFDKSHSLHNTPPCSAISVCNHVFEWIGTRFGTLVHLEQLAQHKASQLYHCISESDGFYRSPVPPNFQSSMNVVFRIVKADGQMAPKLEDEFVQDAEGRGLVGLRGHRSVGGIRVSLYNAVRAEEVMRVAAFMRSFAEKHTDL